jgi:hypothetical protein
MSAWPLHVKQVPRINLEALSCIGAASAQSLIDWEHARGWLDRPERYASVECKSADGAPKARLSQDQVAALLEHGVVAEVRRCDVRGHVRMFAVPEPSKQRWRPIKFTADANDTLGKETLQKCTFATKPVICDLVHAGSHFIALDFSSYFDQFTYSEEIARRFCFRAGGKFYRLNTLAMGQRQAVEVAMSATKLLLDFKRKSRAEAVIDNVIFVGSRKDVLRDAAEFVRRVRLVGGTLNEDVDNLESLVCRRGDWCGVALDLQAKTVKLTAKVLEKFAVSWARRDRWSWRNFAAHVGLLFWSWGIVDLPMADFFPLLRFISSVGRMLTDHPEKWDEPAVITDAGALKVLESWTAIARQNKPRVVKPASKPEWLVCTDASAWGWGYVAVNQSTGEFRCHGAPWSSYMRRVHGAKLGKSHFAEPAGIVNSLCHLLPRNAPCHVLVGTDNTVSQASFTRTFNSHSYDINERLRMLQNTFGPDYRFEFVHIAGVTNPADPFSRGEAITSEVNGESLWRVLGRAHAQ